MLSYEDILLLFPEAKGIRFPGLTFGMIATDPGEKMSKGLYVPLDGGADLLGPIESGAIASLWPQDMAVPAHVPNHFPLFIVDDMKLAYERLIACWEGGSDKQIKPPRG
ncbi:hypothetical protein [Rossellomorea marisflavi]|uniref:hypothetical protein n=1 Tax=Rossellomorea marisflavi TaxID=189381 RepID=UPI0006A978D0|nr:hypothetical protein [Rossellomorea marisflavi]UTE71181.1 hypothetical protein M1I95_12835 [Rossellomorea marisflavi]